MRNEDFDATIIDPADQLRLRIQVLEAQLAMTVARLGGTVEGQPTSELNFLQRIDELVEFERSKSKAFTIREPPKWLNYVGITVDPEPDEDPDWEEGWDRNDTVDDDDESLDGTDEDDDWDDDDEDEEEEPEDEDL